MVMQQTGGLTEREMSILHWLAEGLGTAAIAERLFLSESTAKSHIGHNYQKLGAANRAQALVTAMRIGLLSSVAPDPTVIRCEMPLRVDFAAGEDGQLLPVFVPR